MKRIMPVSTLIMAVVVFSVLVGVIFRTAYDLGRAKERNEYEKKKADAVFQARRLRNCLDDPAVVERLHDTFKR